MVRPMHLLFLLLALASGSAWAQGSQEFGDYVLHFNAVSTEFLSPEVASRYGIQRSANQGLLNVAILKKAAGAPANSVWGHVSGTATSSRGRLIELAVREFKHDGSVSYIATFNVGSEETLDFELAVNPENSDEMLAIRFQQQFFVE